MIDPDREALALLLGACMGCKHITLLTSGRYTEKPNKVVATRCDCPDRKTKQTYTDNVCKYWTKK